MAQLLKVALGRWYGQYLSLMVLLCGGISALSNLGPSLDVREPIVRESPAQSQDNFGFAAVLHQVEAPMVGDFDSFINSTKMIIGAPQGTYPGGLSDLPPLVPEPLGGLVYQCDVGSPGNCNGLLSTETDVSNNDRRLFDGDPNSLVPIPENKSEQLMGSFLASNGEYFLACAPRWVTDPDISTDLDARRPVGRCFVSPRNLQGFQLIQPCNGMLDTNPGLTTTTNNQCLAGFSASFVDTENDGGFVALGVVGDNLFNGNIFYYDINSTSASLNSMTRSFSNTTRITNLYDGYSTTVGFITNRVSEDVISGVPRFDGTVLSGQVRVRSQATLTQGAVVSVTGTQTGEFFGFAVAAADLNNDGYDELIVGAPIYSDYNRNLQETGQVYVYENTGGNLSSTPIILTRSLPLARFGTAVVNLEDVNGDGYEDIAVGSPYEANGDTGNTGAVYIYYGKSSAEGLISRNPDQVILGDDIVTNVPAVQSIRTFGYSLFSGLDVDGNQVNDLLVGAYESKTAVLIRSLSVANVTITEVAANNVTVSIDTIGTDGSMFTVNVCASYTGRGLEGRSLDAILNVSEKVSNGVPRLFFVKNDLLANEISIDFVFPNTSEVGCVDVPVFVKSVSQLVGQVDLLSPLQVEVGFPDIPRRAPAFIGGSPVDLIDYRTIPVLIVEGNNITSVVPFVDCPLDQNGQEVCNPDLTITLLNVTYRDGQENVISEGKAVAGVVQSINIYIQYNNIGVDPAFGSVLTFNLPARLSHLRVDVDSSSPPINCQLDELTLYNCDLPNYIPPGSEGTDIVLVWRIPREIIGNEQDDFSNVNISLVSMRDEEINITNNNLINGPIRIEYAAISDLSISRIDFTIDPNTYRGVTFTEESPTVDEIGQKVQLTVTVRNGGPSAASDSTLDIFIPTNDVENSYYLYLFNVVNSGSGSVTCNSTSLNPQGLPSPTGGSRKRRQASSETTPAPQADIGDNDEIRDCSSPERRATSCTTLSCRIRNLPVQASATFDVEVYLDERFFQSQREPFSFVAYASVRNNEDFFQDPDLSNNQDASPPYRVVRVTSEAGSFPIWIPIVCGIVAVIFIILLFVLLYFVGFFRRKRHLEDTKEAEGDFVPPEDGNDKPLEKAVITEAPIEPADKEIGGTEDLQDGDIEKPNVDPEETSL